MKLAQAALVLQPGANGANTQLLTFFPLTLSWNILHFSSPALSKQVIFLLWKVAHCSFDIKDRSSLFSLKAAIGEVKLYYVDLSEGYNIIQRNDVKQKLLSSTFQLLLHTYFKPLSALACSWHSLEVGVMEGGEGVCGSLPTALSAAREAACSWKLFRGRCEGDRGQVWEQGDNEEDLSHLVSLWNMVTSGSHGCGVAGGFKELRVFSFPW